MPLINQKNHTVEDIYALPDGERAELIDGQIYLMAPPGRTHQRIVTELTTRINGHIKNNRGTCEVNVAPFAVFLDSLNGENRNYVEPDEALWLSVKRINWMKKAATARRTGSWR